MLGFACSTQPYLQLRQPRILKESALNDNDTILDDKKHIVSMRLNNADRLAVRAAASRLFVRESELYRFAVHHLLHRLHRLLDESCTGSDLLPLFMEFREELNIHLGLKKNQLFKIFNGKNTSPDKFVAMADIELLLLPHHAVRQRLMQTPDATATKQANTATWLEEYLLQKYHLVFNKEDVATN